MPEASTSHEQTAAAQQSVERVRFRFLAEASEQLASSLDYEQTLRNVARLAVPGFADWAAVDVLDDDRAVRRLAVEHVDPERVSLVTALAERYPADPDATFGVPHVLRTARPELAENIPDELLRASAQGPEHLRMLEALGLRSYAVVPLVVDGTVLGALTFAQAESGRRFTPADLPFLEDLARRAAVAMHNARLVTQLAEAHAQLAGQADELEMQAAELEETMAELEQRNDELQVLHEEAVEARENAERANEAKSQFLASMSHELRTPLNAIAGYSELLALGIPGALNGEQLEIVGRIQRNQRRLLGMINDVLNFTKLTSTKLHFPLCRVPVSPLVEGLEALIEPQLSRKRLQLDAERPRPDLAVHANAERVEQILLNLLTNAVKFTPASGSVRVSCTEGPGQVRIHVEDTGRGIPDAEREAIFEPFVQVEPEPSRENAGVGLGLAIGRELARAMGGDITVESELGKGSRFTLALPAADAADGPPLAVLG